MREIMKIILAMVHLICMIITLCAYAITFTIELIESILTYFVELYENKKNEREGYCVKTQQEKVILNKELNEEEKPREEEEREIYRKLFKMKYNLEYDLEGMEHFPIEIDIELKSTEQCYLEMNNVSWCEKRKNSNEGEYDKEIVNGKFYLTNQRIIIATITNIEKSIAISSIVDIYKIYIASYEAYMSIEKKSGKIVTFWFDKNVFSFDDYNKIWNYFQHKAKLECFFNIFINRKKLVGKNKISVDVMPSMDKYDYLYEEYIGIEINEDTKNKITYLQNLIKNLEDSYSNESVDMTIFDKKKSDIDYQKELNKRQLLSVTTINNPLLIIAGAGTGKTKTLSYRVAYMIENGVSANSILLLTFTRKAANEMIDRVKLLLKNDKIDVSGGTFHSFANLVLRKYSKMIGLNGKFTILDTVDSSDVLSLIRKEMKFEKRNRAFPRSSKIQMIISKARNCKISIKEVIKNEYEGIKDFADDIVTIYENYKSYNQSHSLLDYDDLLEIFCEKLKDNLQFRESIQDRYIYIMVDEFQDTNLIQKEIIDLIGEKNKNVMVVGDDSQSIYSFRGANFENILRFSETYPNCKIVKLEQNYRSRNKLLNFSNNTIEKFTLGYKKKLFSNKKELGNTQVIKLYDEESEAIWVVDKILELRDKEKKLNNIAVLYRNGNNSNYVQAELTKRNIPYVVFGGIKFMNRKHVKDILGYLKVIFNPMDAASWNRILTLIDNVGRITASSIIVEIEKNNGVITFTNFRSKKFYTDLYKLENVINSCLQDSNSVYEMIEKLKLYYAPILKLKEDDYEKRLLDIDTLLSLAKNYNNNIEKFLTDLALDPPNSQFKDESTVLVDKVDDDYITLSTIHSAKGLEWSYVFIIQTLDGIFPSFYSFENIEKIDEERRLFYVATTRSKEEIYITMPSTAYYFGLDFSKPSRFIAEIDKKHYDYHQPTLIVDKEDNKLDF